mgnify:CR=1 FL=1
MAFIGASPDSTFVSGVFTSDPLRSLTHDLVTGSVFSNEAGKISIEQSPDGVNWDIKNYSYSKNSAYDANNIDHAVSSNAGTGFVEQIILPYWRVKFTATSGTAPTTFRLHARTSDASVKY